MACEAERKAFQEAKERVRDLRQELEDYTGSNKPGGGAPSGNYPEGANEANEELQQIRDSLQAELETLSNTRIALARCTGQPVDYS